MKELEYWKKQTKDTPLYAELAWNIPEQKSGNVALLGGNSQSFSTIVRCAEYINKNFPVKDLEIILPDSLKKKIPPIDNIIFTPSTESGSFANSPDLESAGQSSDATLILGDLSKNSTTATAIVNFIKSNETPIYLTRDTIDLVSTGSADFIDQNNLCWIGTMAQIQKLFKSLYYPKMLLLSQPLLPTLEALHKFTLSYPSTIVTLHEGQIIIAAHGNITTTPIEQTNYSPLSLWSGELAAKIAVFNLYNPNKPLEATTAALLQ